MTADLETVVIGGGVVGLAIAHALTVAGHEVWILERRDRIGSETSSRNSEVIHAGLYYPPGSLRARLCVQGKALLYGFCADNGVAFRRCGKLLVATRDDEMAKLHEIAATAARNGVDDVIMLDAAGIRAREPELEAVSGLLSPSTGVVDSHGLMAALEGHVTSRGGQIVLDTAVSSVRRRPDGSLTLSTERTGETSTISARNVVNAAGLGACALAEHVDIAKSYRPPTLYPAKGHYFSLARRSPFRHHVYPMPQGAWLGVHLTLDVAGQSKFGPDLEWTDQISYDFEDAGGARAAMFYREIRRYWPGLPDGALQQGYVGIRPKIYAEGKPAADFAIHGPTEHGLDRYIALYGIESPGLTASLAIGEYVAGMLPR